MNYSKNINLTVVFFFLVCSCNTSKESVDKSIVAHGVKKAEIIKELAGFSVGFTLDKKVKTFRTDTLDDKGIKRKFNRNGYGGLVTVTFGSKSSDQIYGFLDSSVTFKQSDLRGITEIIYDFSANEKTYNNDTSNTKQYIFLKVANRIYYRRRSIPMM